MMTASVRLEAPSFMKIALMWNFTVWSEIPSFEGFYKIADFWPVESRERLRRNIACES